MTTHSGQLPYALSQDGTLLSVADVESGLACGCVCPGCGRRMVAKKGAVIRHHFAHEADSDCATAFESMAHILAKDIIAKAKRILLPAAHAQWDYKAKLISKAKWIQFDRVALEVWQDGLRPDIVAEVGNRSLAIEIYVTHRCGPDKVSELERRDAPAIEIDLRAFRAEFDLTKFERAVLSGAPRWWLHNALVAKSVAELKAQCLAEEAADHQRIMREIKAEDIEKARKKLAQDAEDRLRQEEIDKTNALCAIDTIQDRIREVRRRALFEIQADASNAERGELNRLHREREAARIAQEKREARDRLQCDSTYKLRPAALARFKSPDRAELWMASQHPRLGRRSPIDVCADPGGFDRCLALLK